MPKRLRHNKPAQVSMLRRWFLLFITFVLTLSPQAAIALRPYLEEQWAEYDIMFYDPDDSFSGGCLGDSVSGDSPINIPPGAAGYERLKEAVRQYGQHAMEMQRQYGTPWDVVFAQMQVESQVGTAGIAVNGATNNWLGITGTGDLGSYVSPSGRRWARYSSVERSITDWTGTRVLRNGRYDAALAYLSPKRIFRAYQRRL